ncbi:MAG: hypothetical protein WAM11_14800 [Cyanobium sp.]
MSKAYSRLREHLHITQLLGSIQSSLYYDQNTAMPSGGASWRGEQLALLAKLLHGRRSSSDYAELVAEAEADLSGDAPPQTKRNLQLLRQELQRQQCFDPALVGELATAQADGYAVWQRARAQADFQPVRTGVGAVGGPEATAGRQTGAGGITRPWDIRRGQRNAVIPHGTTVCGHRYRCQEIGSLARVQELLPYALARE